MGTTEHHQDIDDREERWQKETKEMEEMEDWSNSLVQRKGQASNMKGSWQNTH